jgi:hypothetical protein
VSDTGTGPAETIEGEYGAFQYVTYKTTDTGKPTLQSYGGWNRVKNVSVPSGVLSQFSLR